MMANIRVAAFEDLLRRGDADRLELIAGEILERAAPSFDHGLPQSKIAGAVAPFNCKPGGRGPGGWWIGTEVHVEYSRSDVFCHDVVGWRRDRAVRPEQFPVRSRPDWVCEVVSPGHEKRDLVDKARALHAAEVPYYWTLSHEDRFLLVHRWASRGYEVVQRAVPGDLIRAEPFDALETDVSDLFGDD